MQKSNNIQHMAVRGGKALVLRHVFGFTPVYLIQTLTSRG